MVDGGVHGFKPFVHSDCGGDCCFRGVYIFSGSLG